MIDRNLPVAGRMKNQQRPADPRQRRRPVVGRNPIEKAAGMDIYEVRRRYPELALVGGVDATHLLRTASPQQIRGQTRKIIDEVGAEGRLLIGSSTEVGNDIPLENYLAFHQEAMKR